MALGRIAGEAQIAEAEEGAAIENDIVGRGFERGSQIVAGRGVLDIGDGVLVLAVKPEHRFGRVAGRLQIRAHMRIEVAVQTILHEAEMARRNIARQVAAQQKLHLGVRRFGSVTV